MKDFNGKTAVVTGAASGIGRALADRSAAEGMNVVLADVETDRLKRVADELRDRGATVCAVPTDVSDADAVDALARATVDEFGGAHLLFNNAGVGGGAPTSWQCTLDDWKWVIGVNLWGVIHGVRAFLPILVEQGCETHVVNTASVAGLVSVPGLGPYNVSKHGVATLSETIYHELTTTHPQTGVSCLCPGHVATDIIDSARNRPTELADTFVPEPDPVRDEAFAKFEAAVHAGTSPADIAEITFAGIRERRLWILPHPEWKSLVESRARQITQDEAPDLLGLVERMAMI